MAPPRSLLAPLQEVSFDAVSGEESRPLCPRMMVRHFRLIQRLDKFIGDGRALCSGRITSS